MIFWLHYFCEQDFSRAEPFYSTLFHLFMERLIEVNAHDGIIFFGINIVILQW
jgi:hypothetical protein